MTRLNEFATHSTIAARDRTRGADHAPAREARTPRSFDATLASYIRELSAAGQAAARPSARREPQGS